MYYGILVINCYYYRKSINGNCKLKSLHRRNINVVCLIDVGRRHTAAWRHVVRAAWDWMCSTPIHSLYAYCYSLEQLYLLQHLSLNSIARVCPSRIFLSSIVRVTYFSNESEEFFLRKRVSIIKTITLFRVLFHWINFFEDVLLGSERLRDLSEQARFYWGGRAFWKKTLTSVSKDWARSKKIILLHWHWK